MVTYRLPWPPSVNRIWRAVAGRIVLSDAARRYAILAGNALPAGLVEPLRGRLAVQLTMCPPARVRDWDIANREKILCDTLTKQRVWIDDEQIDAMLILRGNPDGDGYVDILIQEL